MFVVITGATATGKSGAAVALAKKINGEIISADSMQVYRGMDIGTFKITKAQMSGVAHHLIDIAEPGELFSAAKFKALAEKAMDSVKAAGKIPVMTGGTGLYINAVVKGIMKAVEPAPELKDSLRKELREKGLEVLALRLKKLDPDAAAETDLKNSRRVLRALELIEANNEKLSVLKMRTKETAYRDECRIFVLELPRPELYARIEARVAEMVKQGLVDEVKNLINKGVNTDLTSMQAIGYKEIAAHIKGEGSLLEAIDNIKQATRNFAKRQETWFKQYKDAVRIAVQGKSYEEIADEIFERISIK